MNNLTPEQHRVLREQGTEQPFTSPLLKEKRKGMFLCAGCNTPLFPSDTKFESGTGWPSFTDPVNREHVILKEDTSHGMKRTEVICKKCGGHLGHVFEDGPNGKDRYCINGCALTFAEHK